MSVLKKTGIGVSVTREQAGGKREMLKPKYVTVQFSVETCSCDIYGAYSF